MPSPRQSILAKLGPPVYFTFLSILVTYPLVRRLSDSISGGMGDSVYFVWLVRWYQRVIFEGGGRLFFNPWMNYPEGWNLSTTDTTLASALPGSFFSLFFGPIAGYNLAMLLTFILAGWTMYVWVRHLTGRAGAGLVAGTAYALLPYHTAHFLIGHLNLSGIQWFPLYFMGLYDLLRGQDRRWWRPALLAGISLGLIGFTSMYYLYMTLLVTAVFVPAYWLLGDRRLPWKSQVWKGAVVFGLTSLPLLYGSLRPFLQLSDQGSIASRSWEYASMYSASPTDFLLPPTFHFLVGRWVGAHFDRSLWIEGTLTIGVVALVLAAIAVIKRKTSSHSGLVWAGLAVAVVAFILALGTNLHWNNQTVTLTIPAFLQPLAGRSETIVYLPAYWLFEHLPFYAKMRALMRIGLFTLVFSTVLAGLGVGYVLQKAATPKRRLIGTALLVGLVLLEFFPRAPNLQPVTHRPVDEWLAQQPGQGAVVQLPFSQSEDQAQIYYTLIHGKPITGGFFNANQPPQFQAIKPVLDEFPSDDSVSLLRDLKVEYLVVDSGAYTDFPAIEARILSLGFEQLADMDSQRVYGFANP